MEPVSTAVIAALTAGASAGLTETAKKTIADSYSGLKSLLQRKFGQHSDIAQAVSSVEAKPQSAGRQNIVGLGF